MGEFLTPSGLADKLVKKTGVSPETAKKFSALFFSIVRRELKNNDSFSVYNFGTFRRTWIEASQGINPQTGETLDIPAHYRIKFVPCAAVARRINRPYAHLKPKVLKEESDDTIVQTSSIPAARPEPTVVRPEPETEPPPQVIEEPDEVPEEDDRIQDEAEARRPLKLIAAAGIALLLLILLVCLLIKSCVSKTDRTAEAVPPAQSFTETAAAEPQEAEQPAAAEQTRDKPDEAEALSAPQENPSPAAAGLSENSYRRYSVPRGSCYHRIAEEQYGNRHLWPYIYAANKERNPDPDLISASDTILLPLSPDLTADKADISESVLEAYNGYLLMIEKYPQSSRNKERRRLAVRVLVSGEFLCPGFITEHQDRILPEYAESARKIAEHQLASSGLTD